MTDSEPGGPGLKLAFGLCLTLGLALGAHALWRIAGGAVTPDPMADWMTPAHVSAVFAIPPDRVAAVLGTGTDLPFVSLRDLAAARGVAPQDLIAALQAEVP